MNTTNTTSLSQYFDADWNVVPGPPIAKTTSYATNTDNLPALIITVAVGIAIIVLAVIFH